MMEEYDTIIEQILNVPILQQFIDIEEAKGKFLNLVSADWKNRLNEYDVLNRYNIPSKRLFEYYNKTAHGETQLITDEKDKLFLMLALPCFFPSGSKDTNSTFSIYTIKTEPLNMIAKTLSSDIKVEISNTFKFFIRLCNLQRCNACGPCRDKYESAGYKINDINPCIRSTWVYEDSKVGPCFGSTIKEKFGTKQFLSICSIEINRRIIYKNDCSTPIIRIGGRIHKMAAIDESIMRNKDEIPPLIYIKPFVDSNGKKPVGGKKRPQDSSNQSTSRKMTKKEQKEEEEARIWQSITKGRIRLEDSSDE